MILLVSLTWDISQAAIELLARAAIFSSFALERLASQSLVLLRGPQIVVGGFSDFFWLRQEMAAPCYSHIGCLQHGHMIQCSKQPVKTERESKWKSPSLYNIIWEVTPITFAVLYLLEASQSFHPHPREVGHTWPWIPGAEDYWENYSK